MSPETTTLARKKPEARSRVSNGSDLLAGIDGRSAAARRYRDVMIALADDLGGSDQLIEADRAMIRQAAGLTIAAEQMQAQIVRGEPVDEEQLVRVSNALARVLGTIRRKTHAAPKRTLGDLIREHEGRAA